MTFLEMLDEEYGRLEIITEALQRDIAADVDNIWEVCFKKDINLLRFDQQHRVRLRPYQISAAYVERTLLKSRTMRTYFRQFPFSVHINTGHNHYDPIKGELHLSLMRRSVKSIIDAGGFSKLDRKANSFYHIEKEISHSGMKQIIYHELIHALDDAKNNNHLKKTVYKAVGHAPDKADRIMSHNKADRYLTSYEIESQIHEIYQVYRDNQDKWDTISFEKMITLNSALTTRYVMYNNHPDRSILPEWKRKLKQRMHREGILGRNMR